MTMFGHMSAMALCCSANVWRVINILYTLINESNVVSGEMGHHLIRIGLEEKIIRRELHKNPICEHFEIHGIKFPIVKFRILGVCACERETEIQRDTRRENTCAKDNW